MGKAGGKQSGMQNHFLMAVPQQMHPPVHRGKHRRVADKSSAFDMTKGGFIAVQRGNRWHEDQAAQAAKVRSSFSRSRLRPMNTSRDWRFSPSFHGRW